MEKVKKRIEGCQNIRILKCMENERIALLGSDEKVRLYFPYDKELVEAVRGLPQRKFEKLSNTDLFWAVPVNMDTIKALADFLKKWEFRAESNVAELLDRFFKENEGKQNNHVEPIDGTTSLRVRTPQYEPELKNMAHAAGGTWNRDAKAWEIPVSEKTFSLVEWLASRGCGVAPEVKGFVERIVADHKNRIEASQAAVLNIALPAPSGLDYKPFQKAGISYVLASGNALIADEPGLGKTIQAIGYGNVRPELKSILAIVPATLRLNWQREWKKWDVTGRSIGVVRNGKEFPENTDVVIINYDLIKAHYEKLTSKTWDLLILDEAHAIKNPTAQRTERILGSKKFKGIKTRNRLYLTGTPILNRPVELWPLISSLKPDRFSNFFRFAMKYCDATKGDYGWDFSGASNLDELQQELRQSCMVRRCKSDVLKELPPKIRTIIPVEDSAILKSEQEVLSAIKDKLAKIEADRVLAFLAGDGQKFDRLNDKLGETREFEFREIARLRKETAVKKIPMVVTYLENLEESGKVVVFAHHHEVLDGIKAAFGDRAVMLDGRMDMQAKQKSVDEFQSDPTKTIFIGGIRAAGVGITLTSAKQVLFAELDWTPGIMEQCEDRCHRIGQHDSVTVQHLVVEDSIDARMLDALLTKEEIIQAAMNDVQIDDSTPAEDQLVGVLAGKVLESPDASGFSLISQDELKAWELSREETYKDRYLGIKADRLEKRLKAESRFDKEAESLTDGEISVILSNLQRLAMVCDGAQEDDNMGFNGGDTMIGRALAFAGSLTSRQAVYARRMLQKYHRQLGSEAIVAMGSYQDVEKSDAAMGGNSAIGIKAAKAAKGKGKLKI